MMICDLCSTPGKGTIVGPEQMRRAVFVKGFNPFALGLSRETGIYRQYGAGACEYWKTNIVAPDITNWNICPRCMIHLKGYLDEPPKADGFVGLQFVNPSATPAIREGVERRYQPQPVRQDLAAETGESATDRKNLWLMRGGMVLVGLVLGWMPCIGFLAGAVAAVVWILWEKTPPANMIKKGSLAGLLAGIGGTLSVMAFMLVSWAVNSETTASDFFLTSFVSGLFNLLLSAGTGALAALVMQKKRQNAMKPAAQSIAKPGVKLLPKLSNYKYQSAEPVAGQLGVVCPVCGTTHKVTTGAFSGRLSFIEKERPSEIVPSGQKLKGLSARWHRGLYWVGLIFLGFWLGGGFEAGVIAGMIGSVIWIILGPTLQLLFGKSVPIWLFSCSKCQAKIPIATDGKVFGVANRAIELERADIPQTGPETTLPQSAPETTTPQVTPKIETQLTTVAVTGRGKASQYVMEMIQSDVSQTHPISGGGKEAERSL
jgi:hypothetical protein